jgi:hypothetical protein
MMVTRIVSMAVASLNNDFRKAELRDETDVDDGSNENLECAEPLSLVNREAQ